MNDNRHHLASPCELGVEALELSSRHWSIECRINFKFVHVHWCFTLRPSLASLELRPLISLRQSFARELLSDFSTASSRLLPSTCAFA